MMTHVEAPPFARCCFAQLFFFFSSACSHLCRVAVSVGVRFYHTTFFKSAHSRVTFKCNYFICGEKTKQQYMYVYKFDLSC